MTGRVYESMSCNQSVGIWCYQVQAYSAHHMTGQLTERQGVEARNMTLLGKLADQEDSRLPSQNNHLIEVWMPGSFIEQRAGR